MVGSFLHFRRGHEHLACQNGRAFAGRTEEHGWLGMPVRASALVCVQRR